jgi:hypothetical protein
MADQQFFREWSFMKVMSCQVFFCCRSLVIHVSDTRAASDLLISHVHFLGVLSERI